MALGDNMTGTQAAGIDLIAQERRRQLKARGDTAEHDREPLAHRLVDAALAYAVQGQDLLSEAAGYGVGADSPERYWPWNLESFRFDDDAVRSLTKAGALIAAAIDTAQAQTCGNATKTKP